MCILFCKSTKHRNWRKNTVLICTILDNCTLETSHSAMARETQSFPRYTPVFVVTSQNLPGGCYCPWSASPTPDPGGDLDLMILSLFCVVWMSLLSIRIHYAVAVHCDYQTLAGMLVLTYSGMEKQDMRFKWRAAQV